MISCYRKQYAVGQGGLHLGKIYYMNNCKEKRSFAYLYDCGCSNGMNSMKDDIDDIRVIFSFDEKTNKLEVYDIYIQILFIKSEMIYKLKEYLKDYGKFVVTNKF